MVANLSDYNSLKNIQDKKTKINRYKVPTKPVIKETQKYYNYLTYKQPILDELNYLSNKNVEDNKIELDKQLERNADLTAKYTEVMTGKNVPESVLKNQAHDRLVSDLFEGANSLTKPPKLLEDANYGAELDLVPYQKPKTPKTDYKVQKLIKKGMRLVQNVPINFIENIPNELDYVPKQKLIEDAPRKLLRIEDAPREQQKENRVTTYTKRIMSNDEARIDDIELRRPDLIDELFKTGKYKFKKELNLKVGELKKMYYHTFMKK